MYKLLSELKVYTNSQLTDLKENSNKEIYDIKKTMQDKKRGNQ
jgi:hypothetical protein